MLLVTGKSHLTENPI